MAAKADKIAQVICSNGGTAIAVAGDITNNEAIDSLVHRAAEFGHGKIHIIVNNAGYAWDDTIEKIQDTQWGKSCASPLKISNKLISNRQRYNRLTAQHGAFQAHPRSSAVLYGTGRGTAVHSQHLFHIRGLR